MDSSYDGLMRVSAGMALGLRTLYTLEPGLLVGKGRRARLCGMSRDRDFWEEVDDAMISNQLQVRTQAKDEEMKLKQSTGWRWGGVKILSAYRVVF